MQELNIGHTDCHSLLGQQSLDEAYLTNSVTVWNINTTTEILQFYGVCEI